jgi:hypothetical protein
MKNQLFGTAGRKTQFFAPARLPPAPARLPNTFLRCSRMMLKSAAAVIRIVPQAVFIRPIARG